MWTRGGGRFNDLVSFTILFLKYKPLFHGIKNDFMV